MNNSLINSTNHTTLQAHDFEANLMKSFPSTELRTKTTNVYNEVLQGGVALIIHRDRPDMYLMSQKYMAKMMADKFNEGKKSVEKA